MALLNLPLISKLRDKIVEYLYKRVMSNYLHEDYPINKIKTDYKDGNLYLDMNNVVLDENALNYKLSNIYYLNGVYLQDENFNEENFNLPIVFTDHASIEHIKIKFPLFKLLEDNSHVEINQTKIHLKLNLLNKLLSNQLRTNLQESIRNSLMTSSIQIAEDLILNSKNHNLTEEFELSDKIKKYEGYEALADVIRKILSRIEFTFTDLTIELTDNETATKVELKIKRIEINDEFSKEQTNSKESDEETSSNLDYESDDERAYCETSTSGSTTGETKSNDTKNLIKLINLEGVELLINSSLISRSSSKHTIKYDIEQNSIEVIIGSILNFVLNPTQLDALISVLSNKADESNLLHLKTQKSEFKDKKITDEEMIKVKEYISKEKNKTAATSNNGSNKLSINRLNQIWSTGQGDEEASSKENDMKFFPFGNSDSTIDNKQQQQDLNCTKELNPFNLSCKIPGLSICLLQTNETDHLFNELDDVKLDLIEISHYLSSHYNKTDCLILILLNNYIHFKDSLSIKISNLMLCETYKGINELIVFNNGDGTTISENVYFDIDLNENQFNITSKQDILINIDPTLYERLHYYLNFDRLFKNSSNSNLIDSSVLKEQLDRKFNVHLDLKNLNGKLFFPVPNLSLTKESQRQISDIHDDVLEYNFTNIIIKIDSKELKIFSDFVELNVLDNYVPFREDQQQSAKEKSIQLNGSKVCEFRTLGTAKSLIELNLIFKPDLNGCILNDGKQQSTTSTTTKSSTTNDSSQFLGDNLEDSVFVKNIYNLDSISYQPFKTKNRKIVSDENQHEAEKILPNDKLSSINYINAAAKVSRMNVILNVPQALVLFSDQDQLNLVYNRLANDLVFWVPFNGATRCATNKFNKSTTLSEHQQYQHKTSIEHKILESDGNLSVIDENFAHFDANVFKLSKITQKQQQFNKMTESLMRKECAYLETSNSHFDIKMKSSSSNRNQQQQQQQHQQQFSTSFRMCKSGGKNGLEESTESDSALYHSLAYSTVDPIYNLINDTTFVINVNEIVLHFDHKIKEDEIENASKHQSTSSPTLDSKLNSIHEFFSNYQLIENQTILGKKLLIGCVIKMEKENATRVFIHGEDVRFKMNNLGPVNKLQSACVHNNQFLMVGTNKLVNSTGDCKLNLGIEIKRESKELKKIKVAIQLIDALVLQINVNEIMKFWHYVNVTDEDVIGYLPPKILTELHVNLINTAFMIEPECFCNNFNNPFYSPTSSSKMRSTLKNTDYRSAAANNNFSNECPNCENSNHLEHRPGLLLFNDASIVCLIMENTSDVMLKFTFDETSLFFAKQLLSYEQKLDNANRQLTASNQLKEAYYALDSLSLSNYVCNISCGSLEIDLMLNRGDLKEIKLNNDIINITCCYDSLAALICLLQKHLQSESNSTNSSSSNNTTKTDQDHSFNEQRENSNVFNDDFPMDLLTVTNRNQNRYFTSTTNTVLSEMSSNILNTPPNSQRSKSPLLYDPSFLDDDEEDVKINAANQLRLPKPQVQKKTSTSLDSSFYILGYDDFGTGIKDSKNSEPEYNSLSAKPDSMQDCYFTVPQMVNVPIFCSKRTLFRFLLEEMNINLQIFGGTDFSENLISSNSSEEIAKADLDDAMSIGGERRSSSLSSCSSFGSPNPNRKTTVRFADTIQQPAHQAYSSSLANEHTYDKTSSLNSKLSKFDYLATNFGQQLFIFKKQKNDDFFEQIKSSTDRRRSSGACIGASSAVSKDISLWEDLDLFAQNNLPDGFRSSASVAIIKKSGGYKRNQQLSVKLELKKMKCLFEKYLSGHPIAWNASFACSEIELVDCVKKSRINKMLYEYISEKLPKRSQPMLSIKIVNNRNLLCDQKIFADGHIEQKKKRHRSSSSQVSDYSSSANSTIATTTTTTAAKQQLTLKRSKRVYDSNSSDCDLIISMNPLRINIDQDTILFLMDFFTDFSILLEKAVITDCNSTTNLTETNYSPTNSTSNSLANQPMPDYQRDTNSIKSGSSNSSTSTRDCNKQPIFIKHFEFSQDVPIRLDYLGKSVDMKNVSVFFYNLNF